MLRKCRSRYKSGLDLNKFLIFTISLILSIWDINEEITLLYEHFTFSALLFTIRYHPFSSFVLAFLISILLRWSWVLGVALIVPIALPAGGAESIVSPRIERSNLFRKKEGTLTVPLIDVYDKSFEDVKSSDGKFWKDLSK